MTRRRYSAEGGKWEVSPGSGACIAFVWTWFACLFFPVSLLRPKNFFDFFFLSRCVRGFVPAFGTNLVIFTNSRPHQAEARSGLPFIFFFSSPPAPHIFGAPYRLIHVGGASRGRRDTLDHVSKYVPSGVVV